MLYPTHIQCPVVRLRCFIRPKVSQTSHKPFSHALQKLSNGPPCGIAAGVPSRFRPAWRVGAPRATVKGGGVPGELVLPGGPGQCTRIVCAYQVDWHQSAGRWSPALGLRSLQRDFWAFSPCIHHRDYSRRARHRRRAHIDGTRVSTCVLIMDLDDRSAPDNACITLVLAAGVRTSRGGKGPDSGEPSRKSGGASRPT